MSEKKWRGGCECKWESEWYTFVWTAIAIARIHGLAKYYAGLSGHTIFVEHD